MFGTAGKISIVWENLLHQKVRTLVGVVGITFAVVLIFMQLGFRGSAEANAVIIYDQLDFDLVLFSRNYFRFDQPAFFSPNRLTLVRAHPDVERVTPLYLFEQFWFKDEQRSSCEPINKRPILVIAFDPSEQPFLLPAIRAQQGRLKQINKVLFDRESRPEFDVPGNVPLVQLSQQNYWLGRETVHIVGEFALGAGFTANGMIVTSDETYARQLGLSKPQAVNLGLIKLRPGASPTQVAEQLNHWLASETPDVLVRDRASQQAEEKRYWVKATPIGIIFEAGVVVAFLVGMVFVYQVISSDISNRLKEFATLKAIGYTDRYLEWTVLYQALLLALFAYVPGLLISLGLYSLAASMAGIPIGFQGEPWEVVLIRCLTVLLLTIVLCSISALFAMSKIKSADPADLF